MTKTRIDKETKQRKKTLKVFCFSRASERLIDEMTMVSD
jgi:hypothetical protein